MSAATIAISVEGAVLALAVVFIVALLRSHAEILRRLEDLGDATSNLAGWVGSGSSTRAPRSDRPGGVPRDPTDSSGPTEIVGETPTGDMVKLSLAGGSPRTLLAFLSTGCTACGPLWSELTERRDVVPAGTRLIVLTKGADRERLGRLQELAPDGIDVVMSTFAWERFEIPATPHFVLVDGERGILGRGSATSWSQLAGLLGDADADGRVDRARTTSERAARAEQALSAAGIAAGHPSLYPSRRRQSPSPGSQSVSPAPSREPSERDDD